jgi:hypothetical protein
LSAKIKIENIYEEIFNQIDWNLTKKHKGELFWTVEKEYYPL